MRVAIITGDQVANIIEAGSVEAAQALFPEATALDGEGLGIGWIADGQGGYAAPVVEPEPVDLDPLGFQMHVQTVAGMTDADVLAALDDANLRLMWRRLEMATSVPRDAALTVAGLDALVTTGHLTEAQRADVVTQWPTA